MVIKIYGNIVLNEEDEAALLEKLEQRRKNRLLPKSTGDLPDDTKQWVYVSEVKVGEKFWVNLSDYTWEKESTWNIRTEELNIPWKHGIHVKNAVSAQGHHWNMMNIVGGNSDVDGTKVIIEARD